ncbi:MAG TPA: putative Ig domain-containing protein, partial [Bryobacteraceae bacterium]|nr:putative Ig domain-containing protein [Bryobacteraceae bacterium]
GSLPGGLTLNPSSGLIGGQPNTAVAGANFTIQATDTNQAAASKQFSLTINPPLLITTTSPLPAATATVSYSQTFAASGGAGGYSWSATGLPVWLSMSTAGALTGTPPLTAVDSSFTVKVTDSASNTTSGTFAVPVTLAITTASPLPTGQVGVNYSQTLTAIGGTGSYTWSVTSGTLPGGLTLTPATGQLGGQPTTATGASFTIQVQDSSLVTAAQPFTLTINPAASILTLSPNNSNAGLTLQVAITGSFTHFVQGTSVASFGPGIAVGGGTAGQPGPITVTDATDATAEIAIGASAATGAQTVTVTTGAEQASIVNGFTIGAAIPYISLTTTSTTPLAPGFSGFHDENLLDGIEYSDPKWLAMVQPLKPGWLRYPSGTPSAAFNWQTAHMNSTWANELEPNIPTDLYQSMELAEYLIQAKGGTCFYGGSCVSDYATFLKTLGANGIVAFNGYTDTNPNSAGLMVAAAQTAGINIIEWELDNEPFVFPKVYPTPADYAAAAYNPYYLNINAADPSATAGVFFQGSFITLFGNFMTWDAGMAAYSPQYWQGVSFHVYPIDDSTMPVTTEEETLNGILAHGTTEWYSSYIQPLVGQNTPVFFSEMNSDGFATMPFESYIYNAIFVAEWISRMSTIPQVKAAGVSSLFLSNDFNQGMIRAVNDFQNYLVAEVKNNPNYVTNTATNPNTQFQFYYSTDALAMEVVNQAINSSNATWPTTLTGGPTVPIQGYDGNPVPAIFAQGYQGTDGTHYLVITNKSNQSVPIAIEVNGNELLSTTLTVSYISNASDMAQNTATAQTAVQIVNTTSPNPITVGPYSVTRVQW